jgi:hypothetical protein
MRVYGCGCKLRVAVTQAFQLDNSPDSFPRKIILPGQQANN